jgi:two-component system C4-dicarboxylate transport sensor histidine kinase DctB
MRSRPGDRIARDLPRAAARSLLLWSGILLLVSASGYGAFKVSEKMGIERLGNTMLARFDVYAASLEAELSKYEYLPDIAELNEDVVALLRSPTSPQLRDTVNHYLQQVNALARTSAFYVLDPGGMTIASSNFDQPDSFVGMELSFRPYFRAARDGKPGRFYGIGTTSGTPGYYFANAVRRDGAVLGVAALKVSLDKLEKAWTPGSDIVLVADADGVIFLSSVPGWKFRTLAPLPPQTMQRLTSTRQYEKQSLEPLDITPQKQLDHGGRVLSVATGMSGTPAADAPANWLEQTRTLPTDAMEADHPGEPDADPGDSGRRRADRRLRDVVADAAAPEPAAAACRDRAEARRAREPAARARRSGAGRQRAHRGPARGEFPVAARSGRAAARGAGPARRAG